MKTTRVICSKCGRNNRIYGTGFVSTHKKEYVCGLCRPKRFDDLYMEEIIKDFKEEGVAVELPLSSSNEQG